jgi:hypothetical protein
MIEHSSIHFLHKLHYLDESSVQKKTSQYEHKLRQAKRKQQNFEKFQFLGLLLMDND